jgi:hypothetical protein
VQTKLKIGQPGDKYEIEADQVADHIMRLPEPGKIESFTFSGKESNPRKTNLTICRKRVIKRFLNEKKQSFHNFPGLDRHNNVFHQSGNPMPVFIRDFFEQRFGTDLSEVRIHKSKEAIRSAQDLNARAYTYGSNIVFGDGQYVPETSRGKRLLAHELTHVLQQCSNNSKYSLLAQPFPIIQRTFCSGECEEGRVYQNDPRSCYRECLGCRPVMLSYGQGRNSMRLHYKIYYCPDSTYLNLSMQIEAMRGNIVIERLYWDRFCHHMNVRRRSRITVYGFASPEARTQSYNNSFTAMHRALDMRNRILSQCSGGRTETINAHIEGNGVTNEDSDPNRNRFAWIEIIPPTSQEPGPETEPQPTQPERNPTNSPQECIDRQLTRVTGHCTRCPLPGEYNCEADVCEGTELFDPNILSCTTFRGMGRDDQIRGCVDRDNYNRGRSRDLVNSCDRCYRMGVDEARGSNPPNYGYCP